MICADILGLLDALGLERAVIVGHDWGGYHLWQFGLRHPEPVREAGRPQHALLARRARCRRPRWLRERFGEDGYYMLWHQTPGRSEAELEADLRGNLAKVFKGFEHAGRPLDDGHARRRPAAACSAGCPRKAAS